MCCGAMVWTHPGRPVYGASDMVLCEIIALPGAEPARTVFRDSGARTGLRAGVLREESIAVLKEYFADRIKG